MFEFEACEVLKTKEFTVVNDCFQNKHNEKIGHYGQTLIIGKNPQDYATAHAWLNLEGFAKYSLNIIKNNYFCLNESSKNCFFFVILIFQNPHLQ